MDQTESFLFTAVSKATLPQVREFVQKTATSFGGTPDAVSELVIATNEAVTNIIRHGYSQQSGDIELTVGRQQDQLIIQLRDRGRPFDPTTAPIPDVTLPLEKRTPGGLGVHMMRAFTDTLSYCQTENGKNELIMIKYNAICGKDQEA